MSRDQSHRETIADEDDISRHHQSALQTPSSHRLMPTKAATFQGSFAANNREEDRHLPSKVSAEKLIWLYFTEGWEELGIYKSAVSTCLAWDSDKLT